MPGYDKAKIGKRDFIALLMLLQRHVYLISDEKYHENLPLAEKVMKNVDLNDSPFLALAMKLNCPIWSNDRHMKQQREVKTYTTEEFIGEFIKELPQC